METKFNFKSSVCTSREQSERLLELGLKKETADMYLYQHILEWKSSLEPVDDEVCIPAWSLSRLIELMPYCIKVNDIAWVFSMSQDYVRYDMHGSQKAYIGLQMNDDPYSAVIDCMQWLIDTGHFEEDYLKNGGIGNEIQ